MTRDKFTKKSIAKIRGETPKTKIRSFEDIEKDIADEDNTPDTQDTQDTQDTRLDQFALLVTDILSKLLGSAGMMRYRKDFIDNVKEIMQGDDKNTKKQA